MKPLLIVPVLLLIIGGCSKTAGVATKDYSGDYVLTSQVNIPLTGRMHIQFTGVNFSGAGDSSILPYIGVGVFRISEDSIYFTQTGEVPDLFQNSSILEGSFQLEQNTDSLVFRRKEVAGATTSEVLYRLRRN